MFALEMLFYVLNLAKHAKNANKINPGALYSTIKLNKNTFGDLY